LESDDYFSFCLLQIYPAVSSGIFVAVCLAALALLVIVSWVSAAEHALSSLTQDDMSHIEDSDSKRDRTVEYLSDHIRLMNASCRMFRAIVLITVTALFFPLFAMLFTWWRTPSLYLVSFAGAAFLWYIFSGLAPKMFRSDNISAARTAAPMLSFITKTFAPFVRISFLPVESAETEPSRKNQAPLANDAPADMYEEKEMLEEIIHFYNKKANEIMTPRTDLVMLSQKDSINEVVNTIVESGYSRLPVYKDNEDDVRGVLFVKDIIPALNSHKDFEWQSLIREPFYVPESKKIYDLLNELRANKTHIAIVVDEFGCTSGVVTMEDIIEEIIGDISDEYDEDEHSFMALPDGSYIFEGKTQLNDFFRETGIPSSDFNDLTDEAETLTGLMLAITGALPHRRDVIDYRNYRFRILEADDRRLLKIKFSIINSEKNN